MKKLFFIPFAILVLGACQPQPAQVSTNTTKAMLVNMTSDATVNPHSSLMGLHLAQKGLKADMETTVFLNVNGVKLLAKGSDTLTFHSENLHAVIKAFMADGGKVLVCPHCMEAHEIKEDDLLNGMELAADKKIVTALQTQPTVFTY